MTARSRPAATGRRLGNLRGTVVALLAGVLTASATGPSLKAQVITPGRDIELTLELMVELGLRDSYRVRQLQLEVDRTRSLLSAERAGLKSSVQLQLNSPDFQAITDYKWNSVLQRNELIAENTRRWQMDLSVRQPVILFGYPTNGYLSLNNRMYRYDQIDDDERDTRYYNRYFVGYNQPLFQPNTLKNRLEQAQLNLEDSELEYQADVVGMIDDLAGDYYELLEDAYNREMAAAVVADLEEALAAARDVVSANPNRAIEVDQVQVELANAREDQSRAGTDFRLQEEDIKQRLRLSANDALLVRPVLEVQPVEVDAEQAIQLARTLAPRMRQLDINLRENEIRLDDTKGRDSFRMNIGFTYGREVQDPRFGNLWTEPRNSYTLDVSATVPIWDWGERRYRIQAQEYSLQRTQLSIEQALNDIEINVRSQVRSLAEYAQRLVSMQENLDLARRLTASTLEQYRSGAVTLVDLLQAINREADTNDNFLDTYMGYQRTLLRLKEMTFYDFEYDMPLVERFAVCTAATQGC
jgi:outer membrane protein